MLMDKPYYFACIDNHADSLRARVVGDAVRAFEYKRAEEQARAFKSAGYTGDVPSCVQSDVAAKGLSPQQACDGIIAAADGFLFIMDTLRGIRLSAKAQIELTEDESVARSIKEQAILNMTQLIEMAGV